MGSGNDKLVEIGRQLDQELEKWTANIYLDRVPPVGPIGQMYAARHPAGGAWASDNAAYLSAPNILYREVGAKVLTAVEWADS